MRNARRELRQTSILVVRIVGLVALAGCASNDAGGASTRKQELAGGYAAFEQKRYDDAIQSAERLLAQDSVGPGSAEALYLQGRVYEQKAVEPPSTAQARELLRSARSVYLRALATKPPQPLEAHLRAGVANSSYYLEDYATAAREWAAAYPHIHEPDAKAWVLYRAGLSEQRAGRFAEGDRHFATVQQMFAGTEPARRAAAHQGWDSFYVQVGTFANNVNADNTAGMLKAQGFMPVKKIDPTGKQTIAVGPVSTYHQARTLRHRLVGQYPGAMIVP